MKKLSLVLSLVALAIPVISQADSAVRLGSIRVNNEAGIDSVNVPNTCGITKIRFQVRGEAARLDYAVIDFVAAGAANQRLPIRARVMAGQSTGWYDLGGQERCIDRVSIAAASLGSRMSSVVDVIGYRVDNNQPRRQVRLGMTEFSDGRDLDIVNLRNVCNIRQLKIRVTGDDAQIDFIAVKFAGRLGFERLNVRSNFRAGSESNWKDLNGGARCIDAFYIVGRSSNRPRDARVTLLGR